MDLAMALPWVRAERRRVEKQREWDSVRLHIEAENIRGMKANVPVNQCRRCGLSDALVPDPSAYYIDSVNNEGASLLCMHHKD